jgi:hypothetical protein
MSCQKCEQTKKYKELYNNFFRKVFNEIHDFEKPNISKLNAISNHIKDTLIMHGEINIEFPNSLFHTHKDTDQ